MIPRLIHLRNLIGLAVVLLAAAGVFPTLAQSEADSSEPVLVDEFGRVGDCDFGGRLDSFMAELANRPTYQGYIVNYKSADELPGDKDSFGRERTIANHIGFRNFDASRITLKRGGYRAELTTQLWMLPPGVQPPDPSGTVPEPEMPADKTLLYAKRYLELEDQENDFVLESVKASEEAEAARYEAEAKESSNDEVRAEDDDSTSAEDDGEETALNSVEQPVEQSDEAAEQSEEEVDSRTEEEREAERFEWSNPGIGKLVEASKGSSGVIIFYADDERYDIAKLTEFIERGRDRHPEPGRISVRFGGFRHMSEVEFWFVPANGKVPVATPDERPVPEPEEVVEEPEGLAG